MQISWLAHIVKYIFEKQNQAAKIITGVKVKNTYTNSGYTTDISMSFNFIKNVAIIIMESYLIF